MATPAQDRFSKGSSLIKAIVRACGFGDQVDAIDDLRGMKDQPSLDRLGGLTASRLRKRAESQFLDLDEGDRLAAEALLESVFKEAPADDVYRALYRGPEEVRDLLVRSFQQRIRGLQSEDSIGYFHALLNEACTTAHTWLLDSGMRERATQSGLIDLINAQDTALDSMAEIKSALLDEGSRLDEILVMLRDRKLDQTFAARQSRLIHESLALVETELSRRYGLFGHVLYTRSPQGPIDAESYTRYRRLSQPGSQPATQPSTLSARFQSHLQQSRARIAASTHHHGSLTAGVYWLVELSVNARRADLAVPCSALQTIGASKFEQVRRLMSEELDQLIDDLLSLRDKLLAVPPHVHDWVAEKLAPAQQSPAQTPWLQRPELQEWVAVLGLVSEFCYAAWKLVEALPTPELAANEDPGFVTTFMTPQEIDDPDYESPLGPGWVPLTGGFLPTTPPSTPLDDAVRRYSESRESLPARRAAQKEILAENPAGWLLLAQVDWNDWFLDSAIAGWVENWIITHDPTIAVDIGVGYRVTGDDRRSRSWLSIAAKEGLAEAYSQLAFDYGRAGDFQKEAECLTHFTMPWHGVYMHEAAIQAYDRGDRETAVERWTRTLEMTNSFMYAPGRRKERVETRIDQSAVQGQASHRLGLTLRELGKPQDQWLPHLKFAEMAGVAESAVELALLLPHPEERARRLEQIKDMVSDDGFVEYLQKRLREGDPDTDH